MEKLKLQTKIQPEIKKQKNGQERISGERDLAKEWPKSVFGKGELLERIKEALYVSQNKNEWPKEELKEIEKMLREEDLSQDVDLLERAIRQSDNEGIRESAFESAAYIGKIAEMLDEIGLLNSLVTLVKRNQDAAVNVIENKLPARQHARSFLLGIVRSKSDIAAKKRTEAISTLKHYIEDVASEDKIDSKDVEIMEYLFEFSTQLDEYNNYIARYLKKNSNDYSVIIASIESRIHKFAETAFNQMAENLKKFGFEEKDIPTMVKKWVWGGGSYVYMPEAFSRNMGTIESIEKERPGIVKFLMSKFGIYNFGRYPEHLLIKQFDEYENQDLPYGVVMFPEDDHNAVYFDYKDELTQLASDLEDKYLIRVAEVGGKKDLSRLLVQLRLKYGKNHKISFGMLGAHGNQRVITLGNVDNKGDREILIRDLVKYSSRKYQLFEENGTLILLSCEAGVKEGIGREVSKAANVKVVAPKESAGLESIKPLLEDGDLKFKVKYSHHAKAATFRPRSKTRKPKTFT